MKMKRIIAGILVFLFSLNLVQINVNAEEISIENNEEKVIVNTERVVEKTKKEDINKEVFAIIRENMILGLIKWFSEIIRFGIEFFIIGACFELGEILIRKKLERNDLY